MDRRGFLKLVGGVASTPFTLQELKWRAGTKEAWVVKKPRAKPEPSPEFTPTQIFIDGKNFTKLCFGLKIECHTPILVDMLGNRIPMVSNESTLTVDLYNPLPDWLRYRYNNQDLCAIEVRLHDKSIYRFKGLITRYDEICERDPMYRTTIIFKTRGKIIVTTKID